ncbi:MAG: D-alanyl-D-alanine carboxypeptidase/D-alanyl-D-alanine-endopeptidase [Candidatus Gastranaerophilales bacterium]|nr:D-alanyl-D-alanine carboxypeptidase/D-alanyl-D-alanine-endopeptidase [Candidatus Gastranaerophilales bacterium]
MKKIFLSLLVGVFFALNVHANEINKYVKSNSFGDDSKVGIYVLNSDNNKIIYKKNECKYLNPASILKLLTFGVAYDVLGSDYIFETSLYQDAEKNIYVKLGGDVLLTQKDLNKLVSSLKNVSYKEIFIDDSIFGKEYYPLSWLDEDKWPNQRMISPYIVDSNYVDVAINRSSLSKKIEVIQNDDYKIAFINELTVGQIHNIDIKRLYGDDSLIVNLQGTVAKDEIIHFPVLNPEIYFNVRLNQALDENNIIHYNIITPKKVPVDSVKIASVGHSIDKVSKLILHNSDNFSAEVVFKVAASKYFCKDYITLDEAIKMFNKFYAPFLTEGDIIADASGVSRKNFLSVKTISNCLTKLLKCDKYKNLLPSSNEGTLSERLGFLSDNLRAKTGTMKSLSSLAGIFKTRNNTNVVFVTIIQDSNKRKSLLKNFENTLIGLIYKKY